MAVVGIQYDVSVGNSKMGHLHWDVAGEHLHHILWNDAGAEESGGRGLQEEERMELQQHAVRGTTNHYQNLKDDEEDRIDGHYDPCRRCRSRASRSSSSV